MCPYIWYVIAIETFSKTQYLVINLNYIQFSLTWNIYKSIPISGKENEEKEDRERDLLSKSSIQRVSLPI